MVIGGLLVLSVGVAGVSRTLDWGHLQTRFVLSIQILFLTGLTVSTIIGVYNGNDRVLILRDLLAFAFLAMPLFLAKSFRDTDNSVKYFCGALVFAGLCFSLRTVMPVFNIWIPQGELLYLSNSPLALFAAVYLAGFAWNCMEDFNMKKIPWGLAAFAGLALILAAMLLDVQRATIGAVFISLALLAVFRLVQAPRKALFPIIVFAVLGCVFYPMADEALHAMAQKTAHVGMNMRLQEAESVFVFLQSSPVTLMLGAGWGAVFSSPAVGGLDVNYTHSLLTTLALKGGLVLFVLGVLVTLAGLYQIFLIFQRDRAKALAVFWPFVIPIFLYASHKSLDFGLVLLLISVWSTQGQTLHSAAQSGKKKEPHI